MGKNDPKSQSKFEKISEVHLSIVVITVQTIVIK